MAAAVWIKEVTDYDDKSGRILRRISQREKAAQIMTAIRGLKKEIGHLKNTMEHPDYGEQPIVHPSESTRLWCTRLYLERAKEALIEAGGTYTPSQAELKAAEFDDNISAICKLVFSIGGYFGGYETRTYTLDAEHLHLDVEHSHILKPTNFDIEPDYPCSKEEFIDGLRELHLGEWRSKYDLRRFSCMVLDGTQWGAGDLFFQRPQASEDIWR